MSAFQIGRKNPNGIEWESHQLGEEELLDAMTKKLDVSDGLARGSIEQAQKMGERGQWVSDTHKIRVVT